jgi:putative DNA primase/helicase
VSPKNGDAPRPKPASNGFEGRAPQINSTTGDDAGEHDSELYRVPIAASDFPLLVGKVNELRDTNRVDRDGIEDYLRRTIASPSSAELAAEVARLLASEPDVEAGIDALVDGSREQWFRARRAFLDAPSATATPAEVADPKAMKKERKKKSLAELALDDCVLFHDREGEGYATFFDAGCHQTWPVRSRSFRSFLCRLAFETGVSGGKTSIDAAVDTIAAQAAYGGTPEREVARRWAWHDGRLWYDLADAKWRVIEAFVDSSGGAGFGVVPDGKCPVSFIRSRGAMPQVEPADGGSIDELRDVLNVTDDSWTILKGALIAFFLPSGELPIIEVSGEENSGKSFLSSVLVELLDPTKAGPCPPPREVRDLYVRARWRKLIALDNVSSISPEISDALCRIATGAGAEERSYFTNSDLDTYEARALVVLNGIGRHVSRPDLASRTLHVETRALSRRQQRERGELRARWQAMRSRILGALLRAAVIASSRVGQVVLPQKPRLADAALFVEAATAALGIGPGEWSRIVLRHCDDAAAELVEDSPIARGIRELLAVGPFVGSATQLLDRLVATVPIDRRGDHWPKTARGLAGVLQRIARPLRDVGIIVEREEWSDHSQAAKWAIRFGKLAEQHSERSTAY